MSEQKESSGLTQEDIDSDTAFYAKMVEDMKRQIGESITDEQGEEDLKDKEKIIEYLDMLDKTMKSQNEIVSQYGQLVEKLESQVQASQQSLDESTQRETEQLGMITDLKELAKLYNEEDELNRCANCRLLQKESRLLREQNQAQQEVIDELTSTQEAMVKQYKVLEVSMDQSLGEVEGYQDEINKLKDTQE